jgi:hypothetical protein
MLPEEDVSQAKQRLLGPAGLTCGGLCGPRLLTMHQVSVEPAKLALSGV